MLRLLMAVFTVAGVAFALPLLGRADDKPKSEKAGGVAAEHRSEQAVESGNPQWSEGATKGQERAAERKESAEKTAADEKAKAVEKGKSAEKAAVGEKEKAVEKAKAKTPDVASPPPAKAKKAKKAKKSKAE